MKNAVSLITGWINNIVDVMKALIALGVAVGILYDDYFGVIAGIGRVLGQFGEAQMAGLVALLMLISFYNKSN